MKKVNLQCKGTCDGNGPVYDGPSGGLVCGDCFPKDGERAPEETLDDHWLICPYCGHKHSDPYEYFHANDEDTEVTCNNCEREFFATRMVSVTYRAMPLREKHV